MATGEMVSPKIEVWNVASKLCSACEDGVYEKCYCKDDFRPIYGFQKELSSDSLDQCSASSSPVYRDKRMVSSPSSYAYSLHGELLSDNEFEDGFTKENSRPLPPSTTDWESIDSVLENELNEIDHEEDVPLSSRLSTSAHMHQMVFVDSEESDNESNPDVEVYYDDNVAFCQRTSGSQGNLSFDSDRNIDSRDSGYVTADLLDLNIERVTDSTKRRNSLEPVEASTRVLASLKIHEEHELKKTKQIEDQKQKENDYWSQMHRKNVEELKMMKETLELRIAEINMELMQELAARDELNSHHEALLMDADDLAKSYSNQSTPTKHSCTHNNVTMSQKIKGKGFWKR